MDQPILIYDGECGVCNWLVQFILKNEKNNSILFCSAQSEFGKKLQIEHSRDSMEEETLLFIYGTKVLDRSAAVFELITFLKTPYSIFSIFKIFPRFLTDFFYSFFAKKRYLFRAKHCKVYSQEIRNRFLE